MNCETPFLLTSTEWASCNTDVSHWIVNPVLSAVNVSNQPTTKKQRKNGNTKNLQPFPNRHTLQTLLFMLLKFPLTQSRKTTIITHGAAPSFQYKIRKLQRYGPKCKKHTHQETSFLLSPLTFTHNSLRRIIQSANINRRIHQKPASKSVSRTNSAAKSTSTRYAR
jgi:hypothetical protein